VAKETAGADFELTWVEFVLHLSELFCLLVVYLLGHCQLLLLHHVFILLLSFFLSLLHLPHSIFICYFCLFLHLLEIRFFLSLVHICQQSDIFVRVVMEGCQHCFLLKHLFFLLFRQSLPVIVVVLVILWCLPMGSLLRLLMNDLLRLMLFYILSMYLYVLWILW